MREAYAATGLTTNSGGAKTCTDFPKTCTASPLQIAITDLLRKRNPHKTWAFLAETFGLKERAAKHRLANSVSYTIEELQALIQSEDGLDFLVALMADAEPKWWWWAKQVMAVASIKRRRKEDEQQIMKLETSAPAEVGARRRIKGALDANRSISAAVDRAEVALGFQRPDQTGGADSHEVSAPRNVGRAVAAAGKVRAAGVRAGGRR